MTIVIICYNSISNSISSNDNGIKFYYTLRGREVYSK